LTVRGVPHLGDDFVPQCVALALIPFDEGRVRVVFINKSLPFARPDRVLPGRRHNVVAVLLACTLFGSVEFPRQRVSLGHLNGVRLRNLRHDCRGMGWIRKPKFVELLGRYALLLRRLLLLLSVLLLGLS
jgi:hypothetical protein